jgi:hypothetical protein
MIKLTQDMYDAAQDEIAYLMVNDSITGDFRKALEAMLAIVERDGATELAEFRDKLAALAAVEDYIGESGENAARNIRELLAGTGGDDNDPRVQARRWGLEWTGDHQSVRD